MSKNTQNHVIRNESSDPKKPVYQCQKQGCPFATDNLTEVAQHTVANQFTLAPTE